MDEVLKDERFSHIFTDPRFRRIPKNVKKVKVDSRFKEVLKGKKFKKNCRVDERGRALDLESLENLNNLYSVDEDSDESEDSKLASSMQNNIKKKSQKKSAEKFKDIKMKKKKTNTQDRSIILNKKFADDSENDSSDQQEQSNECNLRKKDSKLKKGKNSNKNNISILDESCKETHTKTSISESENDLNDERKSNNANLQKSTKKKAQKIKNKSNKHEDINLDEDSCEETAFTLDSKVRESKKGKKLGKTLKKSDIRPNEGLRLEQRKLNENESEGSSNESNSSEEEDSGVSNDDLQENEESESESSSDSDDSDSEASASDEFDHEWEEQHEKAPDTDQITKRLAVCHMDWDRIRAVDLYAVFNSFKPADTSIVSVKIYPSEFGLKRMEEEKINGPPELVEKTLASDEEEDVEDKKGGRYHREKLRQYQMNRLKYYYAIVECDTPETANSLYEQLNGMEYESSSVRFDLRFVPDDMEFDQEPTSVCEDNPDFAEYKPRLFVTTALQQVKVGLTWDETDPQRRETLQKAFTEPDSIENDIKEYLASSSEESEEELVDDENHGTKLSSKERIQKYKALLESINEEEKKKNEEKYEMEITWEPGIKEKTENLVKEKLEEKTITPFEELQKKRKEKLKLKKKEKKVKNKEEGQSNSASDDSDSDQSVDEELGRMKVEKSDELYLIADSKKLDENDTKVSKKKKKKLKQQKVEEDAAIDVNDPRFSSIFTSPLFNIDPSDPRFKSTPGNLALIAEKQRRLKNKAPSEENSQNKKMKYK